MDESLVFEKTPQGSAEVTARRAGLTLQARRVLIMIDGARSLAELAPLVPDGTLDEVIGLLQTHGLIRVAGEEDEQDPAASALADAWHTGSPLMPPTTGLPGTPMPGPATEARNTGTPTLTTRINTGAPRTAISPPTSAAPAPEDRVVLTVDEVKRRAVRELNERLGPDAERLAMRIERCSNADELREQLREAERLVARTIGESSAQEFVRAMRRRP